MNVILGPVAIGLQQSVAPTFAMTGVANAGEMTWNSARGVVETPILTAAGGGLFDPHVVASRAAPFCTTVFISCNSAVTWTLYMTSGIPGGTAPQVNDPAQDAPILVSGTGPSLVLVNREFLRTQLLRVVTAAAVTTPNLIIANFISTSTSGGRVIA